MGTGEHGEPVTTAQLAAGQTSDGSGSSSLDAAHHRQVSRLHLSVASPGLLFKGMHYAHLALGLARLSLAPEKTWHGLSVTNAMCFYAVKNVSIFPSNGHPNLTPPHGPTSGDNLPVLLRRMTPEPTCWLGVPPLVLVRGKNAYPLRTVSADGLCITERLYSVCGRFPHSLTKGIDCSGCGIQVRVHLHPTTYKVNKPVLF